MSNKNQKNSYLHLLFLVFTIIYSSVTVGQEELAGEIILFPYIEAVYNPNIDNASSHDNDEYSYGVDLFATFEFKNFRFLGEYLASKHEKEFERFQLGWLFGNNNRLWLGRFHNPIGFWNTNFHHGDYLETAISRPAIVEYEDHGGLLPMHLGGLLFEGIVENNVHGLGYNLAIAAGPEFVEKLESWSVTNPGHGSQDISASINLYIEPILYEPTRYGLFFSYSEIPSAAIGFDEIKQIISGTYGNWESDPWRIIASFFYVHNRFSRAAGSVDDSFMHGYIQTEYAINNKWTLYGRVEVTVDDEDDAYLALFPEFNEDRLLGGIRFDFINKNALKLEVSGNHADIDDFIQFKLQWSAAF